MADQARRRGCRIRLLRAARLLGRPALPPPHVAVSPMADRPHRGAACGDEQVQSTSVWGPTIRRSRRLSGPPKKAAACLTSITRWPCRRSGGPPEQSSGFRPRGNDGNLSQILRSAGLHRGSPPSESGGFRNARFYWVFRTSRLGGGEGGILSSSPGPSKNGSKINVFRTTDLGCVYRQYVPEPAAQLKRIRLDGKRFPPSWSANRSRRKVA